MKIKYATETIIKEALKYPTRGEFQKKSTRIYQCAYKRGILDQVCSHMPKRVDRSGENNPSFKWTPEKIKQEALKYKSRAEFETNSGSAYNSSIRMGILEEVCAHMPKNKSIGRKPMNFKWTLQKIMQEALKYNTNQDFRKNSSSAYQAAKRGKLLIKISHFKKPRKYRTNKELWDIAKNYLTVEDFRSNENGAYQAAWKRNILDRICSHMKKAGGISLLELNLFDEIKKKYPKTKTLKDKRVKIENKPHIHGFDIDIYIPELRRGVEFDGKYWHSDAGLKRSRRHWPQEDIENYHQLKDAWFLSKNIPILHIKEEDWNKDKEECIQRCLEFLK